MKRLHLLLLIGLGFLVAAGEPALSQTSDDIARLSEEISRNGEMLERARELVAETSSAKARASLAKAADLHMECVRLFEMGSGNHRYYYMAGQVARSAREAILQTIAIARHEARLEENASRAVERAATRLEQARSLLGDRTDAPAARRFVEEAREQLVKSQDNLREHLYEVALRLAASSESLSSRAIALLKGEGRGPEQVAAEIERTDETLVRAREHAGVAGAAAGARMLKDAEELQDRAKKSLGDGTPGTALDLTQRSRHLAMRAMRLMASASNLENAEEALRLTDMLIGEARGMAAEHGSDKLAQAVDRAGQMQETAAREFAEGKADNALKMTLRARGMLKDALDAERRDLSTEDVRSGLEETDRKLGEVRAALEDSSNPPAVEVFERAVAQQDRAWDEFEQGRLRPALVHTKLSRRLANRALEILGNERI